MIPSATGAARQVFAPFLVPLILLITTFTPLISSHAVMVMPIPYQAPVQDSGPIHANTFPCHAGPASLQPPPTGPNSFSLGSKQSLKFQGSAVHSGGSCQVSITYDNPPTKDSKFRVIKSIEGGCVARSVKGNRSGGEGATMPNPDEYEYTIPNDIPTGNGTIAWTWFNKSGQREMYMACAPLSITGTDKPNAKQTFEGLPEIFKANTFGNGCTFPEDRDVMFPNPGRDVVKSNDATEAWASPTGAGCEEPTEGGGGGAGAPAAAAATTAAGAGASAVTTSKSTAGAGGVVTTAPYPVANSTSTAPAGAGSSLPGAAFVTIAPAVGGNTVLTAPGAWITVPSTGSAVNHTVTTAMSSAAAVAPVSSVAAAASTPPAGSSVPACSAPTNVVTSSAAVATTSAIPKSSAPPSTLLTSTVAAPSPSATASSMPRPAMASTSGQGQTMPETLPPSGACPSEQDGWYVCHLKRDSLYGAYYHRCASGLWTGMMPVPPGLACKMAETAADSHDAAARSKPEKALTLELEDDDPLEIIPVTVARRVPTAGLVGLVDDYKRGSVATGTVAGPEVTSTVSTGGAAADDQQDQDQDYLPNYDYYEEESSSSQIASSKLNIPRSDSVVSPDSPDSYLDPDLEARYPRRKEKYHHLANQSQKRQVHQRYEDTSIENEKRGKISLAYDEQLEKEDREGKKHYGKKHDGEKKKRQENDGQEKNMKRNEQDGGDDGSEMDWIIAVECKAANKWLGWMNWEPCKKRK